MEVTVVAFHRWPVRSPHGLASFLVERGDILRIHSVTDQHEQILPNDWRTSWSYCVLKREPTFPKFLVRRRVEAARAERAKVTIEPSVFYDRVGEA